MKYVKTYESWFGNLFKKKEPVPITLTRHILTNESTETASNSDIAKDVQHIFYDVIDDINVSDYTIEFLIDGIIHIVLEDYIPEGNIEKVYINFLVGDNEQEAFKELVPIIAKKVKIMNRFGFKYLEMKSNKNIMYHHKDGTTFGNTILVAFKKI